MQIAALDILWFLIKNNLNCFHYLHVHSQAGYTVSMNNLKLKKLYLNVIVSLDNKCIWIYSIYGY